MKLFLTLALLLTASVAVNAQTPQPSMSATVTETRIIKLPAERSNQLKQIAEAQEKLVQQFNQLEAQKTIVAQRAALELKLTAEQVDQMELVPSPEGYVFTPRPKETATVDPKK